MTISSNLETFAGRPVVEFTPDGAAGVPDPAAVALRLRLESYGDDDRSFGSRRPGRNDRAGHRTARV